MLMRLREVAVFGALGLLATRARASTLTVLSDDYRNELVHLPAHTLLSHIVSPLPHTYIAPEDLPSNFRWDRVGTNRSSSYLTKPLNQHVPQWCGSCWAHAAMSSLAGTNATASMDWERRIMLVQRNRPSKSIEDLVVNLSRLFPVSHVLALLLLWQQFDQIALKSIAKPRATTSIFRFNSSSIAAVPLLDRVTAGRIPERIISSFRPDLFRTTRVNRIWRVR